MCGAGAGGVCAHHCVLWGGVVDVVDGRGGVLVNKGENGVNVCHVFKSDGPVCV